MADTPPDFEADYIRLLIGFTQHLRQFHEIDAFRLVGDMQNVGRLMRGMSHSSTAIYGV